MTSGKETKLSPGSSCQDGGILQLKINIGYEWMLTNLSHKILPNTFKFKSVAVGQKWTSLKVCWQAEICSWFAGGTTLRNGDWRTVFQAWRNWGVFHSWGWLLRMMRVSANSVTRSREHMVSRMAAHWAEDQIWNSEQRSLTSNTPSAECFPTCNINSVKGVAPYANSVTYAVC